MMNFEEMDNQIVAIVDNKEISRKQLKSVFESVENKEHWKKPFTAKIKKEDFNLVKSAVEFFHADSIEIFFEIEDPNGQEYLGIRGHGYQA